jgi:hypothetical protein
VGEIAFSVCLRSSDRFPFVLERNFSALVPFVGIILVVGDRADVPSLPVPGSIPPVLFPPSRELWILSARTNLNWQSGSLSIFQLGFDICAIANSGTSAKIPVAAFNGKTFDFRITFDIIIFRININSIALCLPTANQLPII